MELLKHPGEEADASECIEEMVKSLMPRFQFEGQAAKISGQVGMQPELAGLCKCCGKYERKKTLLCDVCENSFHLKCLKLRSSDVLLLDKWLCADCSAADGHPLNLSCDKSSIRSSSRKRSLVDTQQTPAKEEIGKGKIRFVLKLKSAHFKGSRALADAMAQVESDRSTDESTGGCVKRSSCQMDCVSYTQQIELTSTPIFPSQALGKELIEDQTARKEKAKMAESVLASPIDAEITNSLTPPSGGVECLSSCDQHQDVSNLCLCANANGGELSTGANGIQDEMAKSASGLCSGQDVGVIGQIECCTLAHQIKQAGTDVHLLEAVPGEISMLKNDEASGIKVLHIKSNLNRVFESTTKGSPQSVCTDKCLKQNGDVCMNDTPSKHEGQATESSCIGITADIVEQASEYIPKHTKTHADANKVDMLEQAGGHLLKCTKTPADADADASPKLGVYVCTHERVEMDASENRSLVKVIDDIWKGPWYKDAIELMGLEPLLCRGNPSLDDHEAMLSSKQHAQMRVRLNTGCLLQVYADCRERCVIVYDLGKVRRDDAEGPNRNVDIERTWSVGGGFYVLLLGSKEAANESVCHQTVPFRGGIGYAVPYVPSFSPMGELQNTCPVWVTFEQLPIYFHPFLQELAMSLGKVLYVPRYEAAAGELSASPRVCVCWKVSKHVPEFLYVDMEGLGSKKLKIEFDMSLLRNLSQFYRQGHASTAMTGQRCHHEN